LSGRRIQIRGRVLFLTESAQTIQAQLAGQDLVEIPADLRDNISTDEIAPGWVCFWYDETLGRYALVGLRNGAIEKDSIKDGGFAVVVSGKSKGCGSSRETAPYAEKAAGIRLVIAKSFEKIYAQNCQNIGLLTSTDFGLVDRIRRGEAIPIEEFTRGLDPIGARVVEHESLFAFNAARLANQVRPEGAESFPARRALPDVTKAVPMTLVEKIIARHAVDDSSGKPTPVASVRPGDALFCRTDVRFSHDYVTAMAASQFYAGFGRKAKVSEPDSVFAFRDHLTFLGQVMSQAHRAKGLLEQADELAVVQTGFCAEQGLHLYGEHPEGGSEAICHNALIEDIALPGQLVLGTDSHTCTAGATGCLAFGVGSTDMANAWRTCDVRIKVPQSVRIELTGSLGPEACAKDIMLTLVTDPYFKQGQAIGQVLEFCGDGLRALSLDERATLTNMAVETGAVTAIIAADEVTLRELATLRCLDQRALEAMAVHADNGASYAHHIRIELTQIVPMVATPGDPRNGMPILSLRARPAVQIAYGGSCTGGKKTDLDMYARVLRLALGRGQRVADGVRLFIQFGSQRVKTYAQERGYVEIFGQVGATLIDPSCGACINAGPGISENAEQVTVSAINRNFPGRSGPGKVYLASPLTVAASAIAGRLATAKEVLG